ncbi:MAG TPA: hypothetical protein VGN69_07860, partial [Solirubrobacteraceae bacterium]|nr:hypothetical protein [Solirubrobacteraceae bacterium]
MPDLHPLSRTCAMAAPWAAIAGLCSPAIAADTRVIGTGVSAGGVDVSGLTVDAATDRLRHRLGAQLRRPIVVGAAGRVFRLSAAGARLTFDARRTAERALHARPAPFRPDQPRPTSATSPRPAEGQQAPTSVALALSHSRGAVGRFARGVVRATARAPRDASLHITVKHMRVR